MYIRVLILVTAVTALVGAPLLAGCGFGGGISDCAAGREGCACTAARSCDGSLTCTATNRCLDSSGGDSNGIRPGDGDGDDAPGETQPWLEPSSGGVVATGGISGAGGTGVPPWSGDGDGDGDGVPGRRVDSSPDEIAAACDRQLSCDAIAGKPPSQARCALRISDSCVTCTLERGGSCGELDVCVTRCLSLVQPPSDFDECIDIVLPRVLDGECLCSLCLEEFAECIGNEAGLCYQIADCCGRAGQRGLDCYAVPECMRVIDEAGVTSVSVALSIEIANCQTTNNCPD